MSELNEQFKNDILKSIEASLPLQTASVLREYLDKAKGWERDLKDMTDSQINWRTTATKFEDERPVYLEWVNRIKDALRDETLQFAEDTLIGILEFVLTNKHITPKQIQAVKNIVNCKRYDDHSEDSFSIY